MIIILYFPAPPFTMVNDCFFPDVMLTLLTYFPTYKYKEGINMNKKEVLEIRKQFSPENCAITRICGCYVDHEKEKKMELKKAFLSLPEE